MQFEQLWRKISSYPAILKFYDSKINVQDQIEITSEMDSFARKNNDREVTDFEIDYCDSTLWIVLK